MSGWDDLFATAAGINNSSTFSDKKRSSDDDDEANIAPEQSVDIGHQMGQDKNRSKSKPSGRVNEIQTQSKKKKIKRTHKNQVSKSLKSQTGGENFERRTKTLLESRLDPVSEQVWSELPDWLSLGARFGRDSDTNNIGLCKAWNPASEGDTFGSAKCQNCHQSPLHHALEVRDMSGGDDKGGDLITAFCLVRDARCCCSCILEKGHKIRMKEYAQTAFLKAKQLVGNRFHSLSPGEAEILYDKFHKVFKGAKRLKESLTKLSKSTRDSKSFPLHGVFDDIVRLMIHCDDVYYRLYYLQISGHLGSTQMAKKFSIPHPPTYFGTNNLTSNVSKGIIRARKFKKWALRKVNSEDDEIKRLLAGSSLDILLEDKEEGTMDPLSFLHQNRCFETITVFWKSGWLTSEHAANQTTMSLERPFAKINDTEERFYKNHHTPAPSILEEWRDGCRDLLCNLYAYATLSPKTVHTIKDVIAKQNIAKIIEIGAGTGYVATILSQAGIKVSAYDVTPTQEYSTCVNEYHGSTPPFCTVKSGTSKTLPSLLPSLNEAKKTALLLCYPPPMSSMAEDTAQRFLLQGGRIIIHAGEFRGLTGSKAFEKMLQHQCNLISNTRSPCMQWGTDAASVTIWSKSTGSSHAGTSPSSPILPCSKCNIKESSKRCRLVRSLTYCSSNCFEEHNDARKALLRSSMISSEISLSYSNNLHFSKI